jgi:DNA-binding transcriptional MerR regulator
MKTSNQHNKDGVPKLALTRIEAAEAIGVTPVTIDRLAKRGLLVPSRATRRPLYPVWEIERFLRETSRAISLKEVLS